MLKELIKNENKLIEIDSIQERDLDKLSKEINISKEIIKIWNSWYNIDGKWYYFKPRATIISLFNELIGERLANYFSVDTVHYELAYSKKKNTSHLSIGDEYDYGIISENFRVPNKEYFDVYDLELPSDFRGFSLIEGSKFKKIFSSNENYKRVKKKIMKMTVLDFYMNQVDRGNCNICFSKDENNMIDLCKLYDYELSFKNYLKFYESVLVKLDLLDREVISYIRDNCTIQKQLYKLMDIDINKIIDEILEYYEIIIPEKTRHIYQKNDERIKTKVKEFKLIR